VITDTSKVSKANKIIPSMKTAIANNFEKVQG